MTRKSCAERARAPANGHAPTCARPGLRMTSHRLRHLTPAPAKAVSDLDCQAVAERQGAFSATAVIKQPSPLWSALRLLFDDRCVRRSVPEPVRGEAPGPTFLPNLTPAKCERCGKTIRSLRSVGRLPHCDEPTAASAKTRVLQSKRKADDVVKNRKPPNSKKNVADALLGGRRE
jgi:hypothetical protein